MLLKPLALLPYRVAYAVFSVATLAGVIWFMVRFAPECAPLPFFAAMSIPIVTAVCDGQDTPLLLAILGGSILLTRAKRDAWAGLVLSLLVIKFQLFLLVPILLVAKRRWRVLGGAMGGFVMLTGIGVLVAGLNSLEQYVAILHDPWINPSATMMPNVHGVVASLRGGAWMEAALVIGVTAMFLWLVREIDDFEVLVAVAILASLLVSFHCGLYDDVLLFPVFTLLFKYERSCGDWRRGCWCRCRTCWRSLTSGSWASYPSRLWRCSAWSCWPHPVLFVGHGS